MNKIIAAAMALACVAAAAEVNLYTDRQEVFLREVIAVYERQSGDNVQVLFVKKGLLERAKAEGAAGAADVFLAVDIGRLQDFIDAKLISPAPAAIGAALSPNLYDKNGRWFAVTRRVRALYIAPAVEADSYEDLIKPKFEGDVCIRSGAHPYNNALFADILSRRGYAATKQWLISLKQNLARPPRGKDRTQIQAVANGQCKIGVANSYYYFHLLNAADDERRALLKNNVKMIIPRQAHINITGMALARYAPNPQNALRFMRFLLSDKAQQILARHNFEFPARDDIEYPPLLKPYRARINNAAPLLLDTARYRKMASQLVDEVGFDR